MKRIALTQRVDIDPRHGERRDALDQRWSEFFLACGALPVLLPNNVTLLKNLLQNNPPDGILLTGGGDLAPYGGATPERDEVENFLIDWAREHAVPLMGVCRGMQAIQNRFGAKLHMVTGHVAPRQEIEFLGQTTPVNSYHNWGTCESPAELEVTGRAADGVIKALRHQAHPMMGVMWHPERLTPFAARDLELFRNFFSL